MWDIDSRRGGRGHIEFSVLSAQFAQPKIALKIKVYLKEKKKGME